MVQPTARICCKIVVGGREDEKFYSKSVFQ